MNAQPATWQNIQPAVMPIYWAIYETVGTFQASRWMSDVVLDTPALRLEYSATMVGFDHRDLWFPMSVQAALEVRHAEVKPFYGMTKDTYKRLSFLAECGVEQCSAAVNDRDLYLGILAMTDFQADQFKVRRYRKHGEWRYSLSYRGTCWDIAEPRS